MLEHGNIVRAVQTRIQGLGNNKFKAFNDEMTKKEKSAAVVNQVKKKKQRCVS